MREEIVWKEERFTMLTDKVDNNTVADAEMESELQGLQAGEERRGSNASQAVECCLGWNRFSLWERIRRGLSSMLSVLRPSLQMPGREEGRQ